MTPQTFWQRVDTTGPCWEWQGARDERGYGRLRVNDRQTRAHRAMWEQAVGPIPAGMCVLHHCDNPSCVRLEHLYLGTDADNKRDVRERHRGANALTYRPRSHCPQGHPYSPENTRVHESKRYCRACQRDRARARYVPVAR
jgi:hypothetical protein